MEGNEEEDAFRLKDFFQVVIKTIYRTENLET